MNHIEAQNAPPSLIRDVVRRQPLLTSVVLVMTILMIPTLIGCAIDDRLFNGVNLWFKPLKFEISLAIQFGTLTLFWPFLDERFRSSGKLRAAIWAMAISALFEIGYILFRAARQEGSHFNDATPVAELLYGVMGVGALTLVVVTAWIGFLILRSKETRLASGLRLSIGLGLLLGAILGGLTGMYLSAQPSHWIGGIPNDATGIPLLGWSMTGGDIRVAHAVGLHAMQGIPLIGFLAVRLQCPTRLIVWTSSALWTTVTLYLFLQALEGQPFLFSEWTIWT